MLSGCWESGLVYSQYRRFPENTLAYSYAKGTYHLKKGLTAGRASASALTLASFLLRFALCPQVHAYIISSLKKEMPSVFGKENKKKELINSLGDIYSRIEREHQISPGDFPNLKKMQVEGLPKHWKCWCFFPGDFLSVSHRKFKALYVNT